MPRLSAVGDTSETPRGAIQNTAARLDKPGSAFESSLTEKLVEVLLYYDINKLRRKNKKPAPDESMKAIIEEIKSKTEE